MTCSFVAHPSAFTSLSNLQYLEYLLIGPNEGLTDAHIVALAVGGVKLKKLQINDDGTNHAFTGEGFASLVDTPICHSLESIHISAESMNQQGELSIGKGLAACTNLRKISFDCFGMYVFRRSWYLRIMQRMFFIGRN